MSERRYIKRNPEQSKHIRKVKSVRNALNNRIKLNSILKHMDGSKVRKVLGKKFVDLCYAATRDGAQESHVAGLKVDARGLHLVDNFLREVPYALVEKERAERVKGIDIYGSEQINFELPQVKEAMQLIDTLNTYLFMLKIPVEYKRICRWVSGKSVVAVDEHPPEVDANGAPVHSGSYN
jgi:hypothetical protein